MASGNPFLDMGGGFGAFDAPVDTSALSNPFMDDAPPTMSVANNPFGAFLAAAEPIAPVVPSNPFADMAPVASAAPAPPRPPPPAPVSAPAPAIDLMDGPAPPPRPPVPEATRHLLASVTGHMEAASDSLFGQLSNVKTPRQSPTHMLSRSPTPPLMGDAGQSPHHHHDVAFSAAFGQTVEELSDHEEETLQPPASNITGHLDQTQIQTSVSPSADIDLWDAAPVSKPKTMDQILSLFNKPMNQQKQEVDLLTCSFHDEAQVPPSIMDGELELSQTTTGVANFTDSQPQQEASVLSPSLPPTSGLEGSAEAAAATKESEEPEQETELLPAAPPPVKVSSPSEEEALRPLQLEVQTPAVTLTEASSDQEEKPQTAAAFMEEWSPVIPQDCITPPTPLSPPGPSPVPSIVTTPTLAEGPPPGQYQPSVPPVQLTPPEEEPALPTAQAESKPSEVDKPSRPPPPARPAPPPARPPPPAADTTPAAPPVTPFNMFEESPNPNGIAALSAFPELSASLGGGAAPQQDIFDLAPAPVVPPAAALDIFSAPPAPSSAAPPTSPFDIFSSAAPEAPTVPRRVPPPAPPRRQPPPSPNPFLDTAKEPADTGADVFDAFAERFERAADEQTADPFDPFAGMSGTASSAPSSAWGAVSSTAASGQDGTMGFEDSAFDSFLSLTAPPPVPQSTPARGSSKQHSEDDPADLNVFIRPQQDVTSSSVVPTLAPPPRPSAVAFQDVQDDAVLPNSSNPFAPSNLCLDLQTQTQPKVDRPTEPDSGSPPATPLFDDDVSQPLEPFPRTSWESAEFEMFLRQPNKKKITGQRFWKKIFVRLADNAVLQLFNDAKDNDPFQELPLQACYSVSDVGAQQYDQYGKIFTVKLQYIFYKERPGVRPGQMTKAEKITKKLGQFAVSAWEGDYDRVKEFASDVRKLGMPVEHAPQISQLLKLGTARYEDVKRFASYIEETLFKLNIHRDRALSYKTEEVQITGVDEVYLEQAATGAITTQLARVRLFFLAFLSGMPDVELGINDLRRQGKEVVGRHDIIPVATEEWIRLEDVTFHNVIDVEAWKESQILKFKPPDGCYIELMRFRVRPPRHRELPLQVKIKYTILPNKVEIAGDILVPGYISRKMGQIPCEDVCVKIPLPECWIYMFRVEKHFRYGSVKASHRRQGKVKGIERFLGTVDTLEQSMMEVSSGSAKYEHHHKGIVWRIPRLPKEGQGAYTNHTFSCNLNLTTFDQIPESFDKHCFVEYTMPHTTVSHTVCRSASISGGSGDPPEKYVRYLARYEYKVEMEFSYTKQQPAAYVAATSTQGGGGAKPAADPAPPRPPSTDSDSDSD